MPNRAAKERKRRRHKINIVNRRRNRELKKAKIKDATTD